MMSSTNKGKWFLLCWLIALPLWFVLTQVLSEPLMKWMQTDRKAEPEVIQFYNPGELWKGMALQANWFLFKEYRLPGLVSGYNGFIFTRQELEQSSGGQFYIGLDSIRTRAKRIGEIQQMLDTFNLPLVVIGGPGKPFIYKGYLPRQWTDKRSWPNNYDQWAEEFKFGNFSRFLDFNSWANKIADTAKAPLLNPLGPDWSDYGRHLLVDTLLRWMDWQFQKDVPELYVLKTRHNAYPAVTETGYWDRTGLLYYPLAAGQLFVEQDVEIPRAGKWIPRILGVSRDHFQTLQWLCTRLDGNTWSMPVNGSSLQEQLEALALADMVILMEGEAGIGTLGQGWVELIYFAPKTELLHYLRAGRLIRYIRNNDPNWMKDITLKAWKERKTVEEILLRDALELTR